jgi:hypothetical protein
MLHVRVASPADRTGQPVEKLSGHPGVQNVVVLAKARRPDGDVVQLDVRDGAVILILVGAAGLRIQRAIWRRAQIRRRDLIQ